MVGGGLQLCGLELNICANVHNCSSLRGVHSPGSAARIHTKSSPGWEVWIVLSTTSDVEIWNTRACVTHWWCIAHLEILPFHSPGSTGRLHSLSFPYSDVWQVHDLGKKNEFAPGGSRSPRVAHQCWAPLPAQLQLDCAPCAMGQVVPVPWG